MESNSTISLNPPTKIAQLRSWFQDLVNGQRQARQPNATTTYDREVAQDVLDNSIALGTQADVVCRALYYMQLYPHLSAGEAMILGSSIWVEN